VSTLIWLAVVLSICAAIPVFGPAFVWLLGCVAWAAWFLFISLFWVVYDVLHELPRDVSAVTQALGTLWRSQDGPR